MRGPRSQLANRLRQGVWAQVTQTARRYDLQQIVEGYRAILERCATSTACYLDALPGVAKREEDRPTAFKALYMLGALGDARVRDGIVAHLDEFEDPVARFVAAQTIDRLTPQGDAHVVTALQAIID